MKSISGYLLIFCGILHVVVGAAGGWHQIVGIINYGVWNALLQHSQELCMQNMTCLQFNGVWWFVAWGLMLVLFGLICAWVERVTEKAVPAFIGWALLFVCFLCAVLMPASGFWLVMAVAVYMIINAKFAK